MKARTYALAALFTDAEVLEHAGGHFTPATWPVRRMVEFILKQGVGAAGEDGDVGEVSGFEEKMDLSLERACRNPGGRFVPLGMGVYF